MRFLSGISIRETLDDIQRFCSDRPEITSVPMILPPMDSIGKAIRIPTTLPFSNQEFTKQP